MSNEALDLYVKTRKDWDKFSSVRSSEETYNLNLDDISIQKNLSWHLPTYSTILQHNDLRSLSDEDKKFVMGAQLLEFVEKTSVLELEYINKVAINLALGKYNFEIPKLLQLDALKLYTDEGYHAYFSKKMSDEIKQYYKIEDDLTPFLKGFFTLS